VIKGYFCEWRNNRIPSFRRKPESIFSVLGNFQMDAVFQRYDVRDGGAKKVTYVDDVSAALRHSGEGRNPS